MPALQMSLIGDTWQANNPKQLDNKVICMSLICDNLTHKAQGAARFLDNPIPG